MMARTVLRENPFEHSPLAVKLTFEVGHQPLGKYCCVWE
jgi:hypothetical protein